MEVLEYTEVYQNEIILEEIKNIILIINENIVNYVEIIIVLFGVIIGLIVGYIFIRMMFHGT